MMYSLRDCTVTISNKKHGQILKDPNEHTAFEYAFTKHFDYRLLSPKKLKATKNLLRLTLAHPSRSRAL